MKNKCLPFFLLVTICLALMAFLFCYGENGFTLSDQIIIWQLRIPKIIVAFLAGGLLAASGLLLQVFFQNPLAGPDLLGINSGASLGVALAIMGAGLTTQMSFETMAPAFSIVGAMSVFTLLALLIKKNVGKVTILILGLLIASFTSSLISLLVNLSSSLQVKNYLVWAMGTFQAVPLNQLPIVIGLSTLAIVALSFFPKKLNLLAMGENYASSMGLKVKSTKLQFMLTSSFIVGVVTVYCGPIGFIGIIAPHLSRSLLKSSDAKFVLPATFIIGSSLALLTEVLLIFSQGYSLSTNALLGMIGAPVIAVYLLNNRRLML